MLKEKAFWSPFLGRKPFLVYRVVYTPLHGIHEIANHEVIHEVASLKNGQV